jgi:uncharacterized delta-60 repeat protein
MAPNNAPKLPDCLVMPFPALFRRTTALLAVALVVCTIWFPQLRAQTITGSAADGFDPSPNGIVYAQVLQSDGKLLVGGSFTTLRTPGASAVSSRNGLGRLNLDGSVDSSFGDPGLNGTVFAILLQSDGKIVVGGSFTTAAGIARNNIARYNADGSLDLTFNPNANASVNALALQSDGRILVGGFFTSLQPNGAATATARGRIARLNANGTLDTTFNPNANQSVLAIAVQNNGSIVFGGSFSNLQPNGAATATTRTNIARVFADGTLDPTFNPSPDGRVQALLIQADEKIIIGGNFGTLIPSGGGSATGYGFCVRLNIDGTVDSTFFPRAFGEVYAIRRQNDGKVLIAGRFTGIQPSTEAAHPSSFIARVNADGSADRDFYPGPNSTVFSLEVLSDGRITLGGNFSQLRNNNFSSTAVIRNNLARINANGSTDTDFDPNTTGRISAVAFQPDGKMIVGGNFTSIGGLTRNYLARLNANGTVDTGFSPTIDGLILAVAAQSDGKVLIGGSFFNVNGTSRASLARLNADGSLDTAFYPNPNAGVTAITVQSDGRILVGGFFTRLLTNNDNSTNIVRNFVARLNTDGTVDSSFDANTNGPVQQFQVLADSRIMIAGAFTGLNFNELRADVSRNFIALIKSNGEVDTTFEPIPSQQVNAFAVQSDGKVVLAGRFTTARGPLDTFLTVRNRIARFNSDGSLDRDYNPDVNSEISSMVLQSDGKILIGGAFTKVGTTARLNFARLNTDGTVDSAYDPSPNGQLGTQVNTITLQSDGKPVITGGFTRLQPNGGAVVSRLHMARLNTDGTVDSGFDSAVSGQAGLQINAIAQQPDGGVILGGNFTNIAGGNSKYLLRLRADGIADSLFQPDPDGPVNAISIRPGITPLVSPISGFALLNTDGTLDSSIIPGDTVRLSGPIYAATRQPDGKILIGGAFTNLASGGGTNLIRINANGTLDASFRPGPDLQVNFVRLLSDGRMYVGGAFSAIGGVGRSNLAILKADGTVDTSFPNLRFDGAVLGMEVQSDGKILVWGNFNHLNPDTAASAASTTRNRIARLNADWTIDTAFNPGADGTVNALVLQSDGKIAIGGTFSNVKGNTDTTLTVRRGLARFNGDGTIDTSWDPNLNDTAEGADIIALAKQADGKILVGGNFTTINALARLRVARLNTDGSLDTAFNPEPDGQVNAFVVQSDSKIVIGGAFSRIGGVTRNRIARLNADGTVDLGFNTNVLGTVNNLTLNSNGTVMIQGDFTNLQPGDAIMIGGSFTRVGGFSTNNFAVLNVDGTASGSFRPSPNAPVYAIATQPDGKVIIGGAFTTVVGGNRRGIARFNTNGTLDTAFSADTDAQVNAIVVQGDGKILLGGSFSSVGGVARSNLARLNADGSVDGSYAPNPNGTVNAIMLQADGSALIGGAFTTAGGAARGRIARISSAGAVDSFNPSANDEVFGLAPQVNGQIYVTGAFTTVGGTTRNRVALVNADGSLDAAFNPNANGTVRAVSVQQDGRVIVGGSFGQIGGQARNALARLAAAATYSASMSVDEDLAIVSWTRSGAGPEVASASFEYSTDNRRWFPLGAASRVGTGGTWRLTGQSLPSTTSFYIRATGRTMLSQNSSEGLVADIWEFLPRPLISSATSANGALGTSFTYAIGTVRPATSYSAAGLPSGLSINASTGLITGTPTQSGTFTIVLRATNGTGTAKTSLSLTIAASAGASSNAGRIVALSTRGFVTPDSPLISGFVVDGSSAKSVLFRGLGPALSSMGVLNPLTAPTLRLFNGSQMLAEGHSWGGSSDLSSAFTRVGLSPLPAQSADAAMLLTLAPGTYTSQVLIGSSPVSGTTLLEVYDASDSATTGTPRLRAMSTRGYIDTSGNTVVGGLAIAGSQPVRLIVRGVGPNLTKAGLSGTHANPLLKIYNSANTLIAQNDNWETPVTINASFPGSSAAEINAAAASVGLTAYDAGSKDAAIVVTLSPGVYTMDVTSGDTTVGIGMVEIYLLP